MLYSYGSFLSRITLSLLCIVVPVPYVSINPSKKREVQVVFKYNKNMNDKLDIYFSKVFCRMRHKTQLFNGAADDHYHTRLQHTIEVEEIALKMAKKLMYDNSAIKCDLSKVSKIALLHDIGHTPFGHAGERALHEIISGQCCKEHNLPDFNKLGVIIGFKHNINSGLLYIESVKFDNVDFDILDGIVRHTKLYYENQQDLDYGFKYIFHERKEYYDNKGPKTLEGFIVAYADEIAQICSDYLDICLDSQSKGLVPISFKSRPFTNLSVSSSEKRVEAKAACDYLIDLFADCFKQTDSFSKFNDNEFLSVLDEFDEARKNYIKSNKSIIKYDDEKSKLIKSLFAFYYNNPDEITNDFFDDFVYRSRRIEYETKLVLNDVSFHTANKKETIKFIERVYSIISEQISGEQLTNNNIKDYRNVFKLYLRSLAVFISKMTDNYAEHKFSKTLDIK